MTRYDWNELDERNRQVQQRPKQLFLLAVLVGCAFLLASRHLSESPSGEATEPGEEGAEVMNGREQPRDTFDLVEDAVDASPDHVELPPRAHLAQQAGRTGYIQVYECSVNGHRVVSDQPCGEDAQARVLEVDRPDPYEVSRMQQQQMRLQQLQGAAGSTPMTTTDRARSRASSSADASSNAMACESVDRAIETLNARMRHSYTSAEGEYLRKRWHDLKKQRYDLGCGR